MLKKRPIAMIEIGQFPTILLHATHNNREAYFRRPDGKVECLKKYTLRYKARLGPYISI
jgi:hypothetical protein